MNDLLNILDKKIFLFVNGNLANPFFDMVMPVFTDIHKQALSLIIAGTVIAWMLIRGGYRARLLVIVLIASIIVSDQLSSAFIKYLFERTRPCHVLNNVRMLVGCGSGYSFPSSHAVNNFSGALVLTFFYPRGKLYFFTYAILIAFSRIYVGVHYPSDVIGGSIIGMICGGGVILLFLYFENLWQIHFKNKLLNRKFE